MRFRRLKTVTAIIISIVVLVCMCVALVRKFVIPIPPEIHHTRVELPRTETADERFMRDNDKAIRLAVGSSLMTSSHLLNN